MDGIDEVLRAGKWLVLDESGVLIFLNLVTRERRLSPPLQDDTHCSKGQLAAMHALVESRSSLAKMEELEAFQARGAYKG